MLATYIFQDTTSVQMSIGEEGCRQAPLSNLHLMHLLTQRWQGADVRFCVVLSTLCEL